MSILSISLIFHDTKHLSHVLLMSKMVYSNKSQNMFHLFSVISFNKLLFSQIKYLLHFTQPFLIIHKYVNFLPNKNCWTKQKNGPLWITPTRTLEKRRISRPTLPQWCGFNVLPIQLIGVLFAAHVTGRTWSSHLTRGRKCAKCFGFVDIAHLHSSDELKEETLRHLTWLWLRDSPETVSSLSLSQRQRGVLSQMFNAYSLLQKVP